MFYCTGYHVFCPSYISCPCLSCDCWPHPHCFQLLLIVLPVPYSQYCLTAISLVFVQSFASQLSVFYIWILFTTLIVPLYSILSYSKYNKHTMFIVLDTL